MCLIIRVLSSWKISHSDISFDLPSAEELQSSGGVEFHTDQSQIYIPYTAIQHQKETEGIYLSYTINTATY